MSESTNILKRICQMAEDDNQGLQMSITVTDASKLSGIGKVTFQTTPELVNAASCQAIGLPSEYICCALFIKKSELEKYKTFDKTFDETF